MSWSFSVGPVHHDNLEAELERKADEHIATLSERTEEEVRNQMAAAVQAIKGLVASGTLGPPSHFFHVTLSGHANPGHGPRPGWSNDCVSLNISQSINPESVPQAPAAK